MDNNLNETVRIFSNGEVYTQREENFDFTLLLHILCTQNDKYRIGLNVMFEAFGNSTQLASDAEFRVLRDNVRNRVIFPFISPARNYIGEEILQNNAPNNFAVLHKLDGQWVCSYITFEQCAVLMDELDVAYVGSEDYFLCNLYSLLVFCNVIPSYKDEFTPIEQLNSFIPHAIIHKEYAYINFHTFHFSEEDEVAVVVCVLCISRTGTVKTFYVDPIVADYMYNAVMGQSESLITYLSEFYNNSMDQAQAVETLQSVAEENEDRVEYNVESSLDENLLNTIISSTFVQEEENVPAQEEENLSAQEEENLSAQEEPVSEDTLSTIDARLFLSENSNTYLIDETTSRFSDAVWYEEIQNTKIMIAGLGGIGSWVAFLLARMKPKSIKMIDPDTVEMVNMAGQLFGSEEIGVAKVTAMSTIMSRYCDFYKYVSYIDSYNAVAHGTSDIMICGFDNMYARRTYFQAWCEHKRNLSEEEKKKCLFIDGRLNAEEFQIFCIRGDHAYHQKKYVQEWLFEDYKAEEATCSYKQTSFCANMIASYMVNLFVNHIANRCDVLIERPLPFFTYYNAETMQFKTE